MPPPRQSCAPFSSPPYGNSASFRPLPLCGNHPDSSDSSGQPRRASGMTPSVLKMTLIVPKITPVCPIWPKTGSLRPILAHLRTFRAHFYDWKTQIGSPQPRKGRKASESHRKRAPFGAEPVSGMAEGLGSSPGDTPRCPKGAPHGAKASERAGNPEPACPKTAEKG